MEISVIVPVYNLQNLLSKCVDSIIDQSLSKSKYEVLLIDDGSTDRSGDLCDEYSRQYSFIKSFHKPNGGLSDARNFGLKHATGKYIAFIDSDDAIGPNYLEILYSLIKKYNVDIASVEAKAVRSINDDTFKVLNKGSFEKKLTKKEALQSALIRKNLGISAWAYLYRRDLFIDIEYPKDTLYEDLFTTPYILDRANNGVGISNAIQYLYYVRKDSITHRKVSNEDLVWFKGMDKLEQYVDSKYSDMFLAFQCRYLSDIVSILCNRAVFIKGSKNFLKMILHRKSYLWKGYLKNPFISNRMKMQILVLKISPFLYRKIISLFLR